MEAIPAHRDTIVRDPFETGAIQVFDTDEELPGLEEVHLTHIPMLIHDPEAARLSRPGSWEMSLIQL